MQKIVRFFLPILGLLLIWESISRSGLVNAALFPAPSKVAAALVEMFSSGEMIGDIRASAVRLFAGLFLGGAIGIALGLLTGRNKFLTELVGPVIQFFRPLPPVAIIPLVIVWFGIGETAKIFSIAFAVFFPVWLNTHLGALGISSKLLWSASKLTDSKLKIFWRVIFPASLPFIVAGLRTGIAVAFVMVFVSELAGASEGVGFRISISNLAYRIDQMIAALAVLGASGALADYVFSKGIVRLYPWLKFAKND
jgi:ABC-type nitrate/sulfonate/bicarbonate transport system permease component